MATAVQRVGKLGRLLQATASSGPGIASITARNNTGIVTITARNMASFYDIKAKTLDGRVVSMSDFKGKAVLIENTASL